MKREKRNGRGGGVKKKKGKSAAADHEKQPAREDQVAETAEEDGGDVVKAAVVEEKTVVGFHESEEWQELDSWSSGVVVDEQMSWGTFGYPFWNMGHEAYHKVYNESYSDVLDDYDIWDLKGIHVIPNP